jgi:hypothetical protein
VTWLLGTPFMLVGLTPTHSFFTSCHTCVHTCMHEHVCACVYRHVGSSTAIPGLRIGIVPNTHTHTHTHTLHQHSQEGQTYIRWDSAQLFFLS